MKYWQQNQKAVDNVVMTVESRVPGALSTAMDNLMIPLFEKPPESVNAWTGQGLFSIVRKPYQKDFTVSAVSVPRLSVSTRVNLHIDRDRYVEIWEMRNRSFEDGSFQALAVEYDKIVHAHHKKHHDRL